MYQHFSKKRISVFSVIIISILFTAFKCDTGEDICTEEPYIHFSFKLNNNSDSAILIQDIYTIYKRNENGKITYRYHLRDQEVALNDSVLFPESILPPHSSGIIKSYHYDKDKEILIVDVPLLICDPNLDKNETFGSLAEIEKNQYVLRFIDPLDSDVDTRKKGLIINYP